MAIGCVKIDGQCDPTQGRQLGSTEYGKEGNWQICADKCYRTLLCAYWDFLPPTILSGAPYECRLFRRCTILIDPFDYRKYLAGPRSCHSVALSCTDAHKTCLNLNAANIIRKINTISSWEDCGNHCKKDSACNFWTYHDVHKCDLLKSCTPTSSEGYLTGHRKCPSISK